MTDAVAVAYITTIGGVIGLCLKRLWDGHDRRRADTAEGREECERYKIAFRALMHLARQRQQSIIAIEEIRHENPDYAMGRLTELAGESNEMFDRLRDYVMGKSDEI